MSLFGLLKQPFARLGSDLVDHLRTWMKPNARKLMAGTFTDLTRSKQDLLVENALLRQQLIVLERQVKRPELSWRERAVIVILASRLVTWKDAMLVVKPETVLRWHRDLFRWVWRRKSQAAAKSGRTTRARRRP
jgi:hypothetical protein